VLPLRLVFFDQKTIIFSCELHPVLAGHRRSPEELGISETFSKVEVITGVARRRRFTTEQKLSVVNETLQPGMSISYVARRHGLSPSLVFRWRRLMSEGRQGSGAGG